MWWSKNHGSKNDRSISDVLTQSGSAAVSCTSNTFGLRFRYENHVSPQIFKASSLFLAKHNVVKLNVIVKLINCSNRMPGELS